MWAFGAGEPHRDGAEIDPVTGALIRALPTPPRGYAFGSLWTGGTDQDGRAVVVRSDPTTGDTLQTYVLPDGLGVNPEHGKPGGFVETGGFVWMTAYEGDVHGREGAVTEGALLRLDPNSDAVEQILPLSLDPSMQGATHSGAPLDEYTPGPEVYLTSHGGSVWVARSPDTVVEVDAVTGAVVQTFAAAGTFATNVEVTDDAVWITNYGDDSVWRYDLSSSS